MTNLGLFKSSHQKNKSGTLGIQVNFAQTWPNLGLSVTPFPLTAQLRQAVVDRSGRDNKFTVVTR